MSNRSESVGSLACRSGSQRASRTVLSSATRDVAWCQKGELLNRFVPRQTPRPVARFGAKRQELTLEDRPTSP
jgi:hypothetical protein